MFDGFDEGTRLRSNDRRSAQLGFHVNAAEGLKIQRGSEETSELAQEMPSFAIVQGGLVAHIRALSCVCVFALTTDDEVHMLSLIHI